MQFPEQTNVRLVSPQGNSAERHVDSLEIHKYEHIGDHTLSSNADVWRNMAAIMTTYMASADLRG
eukprot:2294039-Prorocentrum_lima.AAC.1